MMLLLILDDLAYDTGCSRVCICQRRKLMTQMFENHALNRFGGEGNGP